MLPLRQVGEGAASVAFRAADVNRWCVRKLHVALGVQPLPPIPPLGQDRDLFR
jgi:hypothetical protein